MQHLSYTRLIQTVFLAAVLILPACGGGGGGGDGSSGGSQSTAGSLAGRAFNATANTTVTVHDGLGNPVSSIAFTRPMRVSFANPVSGGGLTETNPINLNIAPAPETIISNATPGQFSIVSAEPFLGSFRPIDPSIPNTPELMVQYWSLQLDGNRLTGQLVDEHKAEGVALNLFATPLGFGSTTLPMPMLSQASVDADITPLFGANFNFVGTRLSGTVSPGGVSLRVEGTACCNSGVLGFVSFVSEIQSN